MKNLTKVSLLSLLVSGSCAVNAAAQDGYQPQSGELSAVYRSSLSSQPRQPESSSLVSISRTPAPSLRDSEPQSGGKGFTAKVDKYQRQNITFLNEKGEGYWTVVQREGMISSDQSIRRNYDSYIVQKFKQKIEELEGLEEKLEHLRGQEVYNSSAREQISATQRQVDQLREEVDRLALEVARDTMKGETPREAETRKREGALLIANYVKKQEAATERRTNRIKEAYTPYATMRRSEEPKSSADQEQSQKKVREERERLAKEREEQSKRIAELEESLSVNTTWFRASQESARRPMPNVSNAPSGGGNAGIHVDQESIMRSRYSADSFSTPPLSVCRSQIAASAPVDSSSSSSAAFATSSLHCLGEHLASGSGYLSRIISQAVNPPQSHHGGGYNIGSASMSSSSSSSVSGYPGFPNHGDASSQRAMGWGAEPQQPAVPQPDYTPSFSAQHPNGGASYGGGYGAGYAPTPLSYSYGSTASLPYGHNAAPTPSYGQGPTYSPAPQTIVPSAGQYYSSSNSISPTYGYSASFTSMPLHSQTLSATYSGVAPGMPSQSSQRNGNAYNATYYQQDGWSGYQ